MSNTTRETLRKWFEEGVAKHATHMIVAYDTFDHGDFPVYVMTGQDAREEAKKYSDESKMLRLMEVYNLQDDPEDQLANVHTINYGDDPEDDGIVDIVSATERRVPIVTGTQLKDQGEQLVKLVSRIFICLCCGKRSSFDCAPGERVTELAKASGFRPIMMKDTSMGWMCPGCADKAIPHVQALIGLLHDPNVFWDGLRWLIDEREMRT